MLTEMQKNDLQDAINNYDFPCVAYDYQNDVDCNLETMNEVENYIRELLVADDVVNVKNGLSNVLYWGYATAGYRDSRIEKFRVNVTNEQIVRVQNLFRRDLRPTINELANISMPQFSGISFLSKICMFLNPESSAILDKQIMKMKFTNYGLQTVLGRFSHSDSETQIRPSKPNSIAYEAWCEKLINISNIYFDGQYRCVDIERGLFMIIRGYNGRVGNPIYAAEILANA